MDKAEKMVEAIKARLAQYEEERTAEIQRISADTVAEISRRVEEVTAALAITEPEQLKSLIDKGGTVRQIMVSCDRSDQNWGAYARILSYMPPSEAGDHNRYRNPDYLEMPELGSQRKVRLTIIAEPLEAAD